MNKVVLSSEISGSVWKIKCNVGDVIEEGQEILIIESMKMEIPVTAPEDGTVTEILTKEENTVAEGDVVARIEA